MKKVSLVAILLILIMAFASVSMAADQETRQPDVYVNEKIVEFADQAPYITDEGRTLVPARGVFEAMGCEVLWDSQSYVVTVSNQEQGKEIILKIGDEKMTVKTGQEEKTETLDVPAQLMNNRTMIPLRAVSEALESIVVWNPGDYSVYITMPQKVLIDDFVSVLQGQGSGNKGDKPEKEPVEKPTEEPEIKEEDKMILSLYTDAKDVSAGDEIEVFVKVENPPEDMTFVGLAIGFVFDKEEFEFVKGSAKIYDADGKVVNTKMNSENAAFDKGVKAAYACRDGAKFVREDAEIYSVKFKALTDEGGKLSLSDGYVDGIGYDMLILLNNGKDDKALMYEGEWIIINTDPLELN